MNGTTTLELLRRDGRVLAVLRTVCGLRAAVDPGAALPFPGGALSRLRLAADPDLLEEADAGRLLRLARRLLGPGGVLEAPGGAAPGPRARAADRLAWTCGFTASALPAPDAPRAPEAPGRRWRTPAPAEPAVPLVSIVIPAYKPDHFGTALASALDQDYPRLEILVCDDSGGDAVRAVVDGFGGMRHKVRYLRNPGTLGGRANYLKGLDQAWGDYVKFLNDDDVLAPDCVSTMARLLRATPGATLVTSYRRLIDARGNVLPDQPCNEPVAAVDTLLAGEDLAGAVLASGCNRIGEPTTVMFRKADVADARPHAMSYRERSALRNGDLTLWVSLLSRGDAVYVARPLSDFRLHDGQFSHDAGFRREAVRAWDILRADAAATGLVRPADRRGGGVPLMQPDAALREAASLLDAGDAAGAEAAARRAARLAPLRTDARLALAQAQWRAGRHGHALLGLAYAAAADDGARLAPPLADLLAAAGLQDLAQAVRTAVAASIPSPS